MTLSIRHDWTTEEIQTLLELPLMELLWQAQTVHREANPGYRVQLASLLSVKTGGCEDDCASCSQSIHNSSDVTAFEAQMQVEPVLQRARAAKEAGADRFCMGWAWREIRAIWRRQAEDPAYQFDTPLPVRSGPAAVLQSPEAAAIGDIAPRELRVAA